MRERQPEYPPEYDEPEYDDEREFDAAVKRAATRILRHEGLLDINNVSAFIQRELKYLIE